MESGYRGLILAARPKGINSTASHIERPQAETVRHARLSVHTLLAHVFLPFTGEVHDDRYRSNLADGLRQRQHGGSDEENPKKLFGREFHDRGLPISGRIPACAVPRPFPEDYQ